LVDRALTTGQLLSQSEIVEQKLIQEINNSTKLALVNKTLDVYDTSNNKIYSYDDNQDDSLILKDGILNKAKTVGTIYFTDGNRQAVALYYKASHSIIVASGYDKDGGDILNKLFWILCCSFFGSLIIVFISGYYFSNRLLKPIKKIADDVNEISAQNLTRRIGSDTANDEWKYLTDTLNELLNRLQDSFEIQRRFISNASHELTNPLSAISSQLEVSLQRPRESGEYKEVIQSVFQDVLHLNNLIHTLLEFAKASGSAGGLEISLVRIDEVLLKLKSEISKLNKTYTIILDFQELPEDEEALLVFGNEKLLFTSLNNIVSNACKYSEDRLANVMLEVRNKEAIITITDKGKGIEMHDLENIFHPFYRSESSKDLPGTGLGLTLANRIIKLHKGYITVNSVIDKGTVFVITLPTAQKLQG